MAWRFTLAVGAMLVLCACAVLSPAASVTPTPRPTTVPSTPSVIPSPETTTTAEPTASPSLSEALPLDVHRLGDIRPATSQEAEGTISEDVAIDDAKADGYRWPNPTAYLVVITRNSTTASDEPLVDRLVWLLRWDDLNISFPAPAPAEGTANPRPYRYGYVYVDARSGEVLGATYMD